MIRMLVPVLSAAALAACATASPGGPPPGGGGVSTEQDCAVIAAVAREHYRFGPDNRPPPLWRVVEDGAGRPWRLDCDWARHGLSFPETYDPDAPTPGRVQWVKFERPRYDSQGAVVETGILHGPLAGVGHECRLRSGVAGWTVTACRGTWIS